jgi:hypothetical protein
MKKSLLIMAMISLTAASGFAGTPPQTGTVLSQTSVACGQKKSKKQDLDLMCHQYVIRSGSIDYTIQQAKPEDQTLITLNAPVEFKLDKSKMKLKANGKSYEFLVVSQAAAPAGAANSPSMPSQR